MFNVLKLSLAAILIFASLGSSACGDSRTVPTAVASSNPFAAVKGIVDPDNHGWPRTVEVLNGKVTIPSKPQRILTVSLGHDEVTYALVPAQRVVAVGEFTKKDEYSNVAKMSKDLPVVTRDPERITSFNPDIVIVSAYSKPELVASLNNVGILVVQTELNNHFDGRVNDILLMGYIYGEEQRALAFAVEVTNRSKELSEFVKGKTGVKPRVISLVSFSDKIYTAGKDSTEGEIIEMAGAVNLASEAGLEHNPIISLESVIAMSPDVILVTEPEPSASEFIQKLRTNKVLAEVPAVKNNRIYVAVPRYFTTLSFWNLRGAEETAKIIWPELKDKQYQEFSFPR
ncbi:MAG: ABC transporter substrate-binding protein [Dehalococcoidia bacterium]|nr:ABC transporter substrate-binding protein [Dehalococcoidia bacterium]